MGTKEYPLFGSSGSQRVLLNGCFDTFQFPENLTRTVNFSQG